MWSKFSQIFLAGVSFHQGVMKRVMNASAQLVYCAPRYCHITPLLRELHWLPVHMCVDFKILLITFKILQGFTPSYLKNLVSILPASHYQLCQNNNGILLPSPRFKSKKTMGDHLFIVAAPILGNRLPLSVRQTKDIDNFKHSVKYYLFSKAFC